MTICRIPIASLFLLLLAVPISGCGSHRATSPTSPAQAGAHAARLATISGADVQHVEGRTGPASFYYLDVPPNWNHDLVVYAHGITLPPDKAVGQPNYIPLRDLLLARGFAVAVSSFDVNGYALKDGFLRTHQLSGLFAARFGQPARTYLLGRSLGGIIVQRLAETFPEQYAGALSVAGVLGGSRAEVDYIGTIRVLFDYFSKGKLAVPGNALPGNVLEVPPMTEQEFGGTYAPAIVSFLSTHPDALMAIVALMGDRLEGNGPPEWVEGITLALAFQLLDDSDVLDQTHGHSSFDNSGVVYSSALLPQALLDDLNAKVERHVATPDAIAYLDHYYGATGNLLIPMLAVHNARDPQVPCWHEDLYQALVVARGHGGNLSQSEKPTFGHDKFTPDEVATAFDGLVNWVENGVKPTRPTP